MRATEFIAEYKKYPTVEHEGVTFTMAEKDGQLMIRALNDFGIPMAHVTFNMDGRELDPQDLAVDDRYQGQGIARVMYDYIKSRGFTINRSWDQTDAGAGFWNKHRGEDVRVWEQDMTEEQLDELTFMGSQCTKDCSGHRAGYNWSVSKGRKSAASWSNSFNKGAELAATGH